MGPALNPEGLGTLTLFRVDEVDGMMVGVFSDLWGQRRRWHINPETRKSHTGRMDTQTASREIKWIDVQQHGQTVTIPHTHPVLLSGAAAAGGDECAHSTGFVSNSMRAALDRGESLCWGRPLSSSARTDGIECNCVVFLRLPASSDATNSASCFSNW